MSQAALVTVNGLVKSYDERGTSTPVLRGAEFSLKRGQVTGMLGTSGAGKSTLLAILAGLMLPDSGSVDFDGERLSAMDETQRAALRANRIGVVLQSDNLIPFLTARENVELAISIAGVAGGSERAGGLLGELGLEARADELPRRLSGGEAQRVALAVALVNDPDLLLADEVTAELDSTTAGQMLDLIRGVSKRRGLTVMLVTHSPELAELTDRRLRVSEGGVIEF